MKKMAVFVVGAVLAVSAFGQTASWLGDSYVRIYSDNPHELTPYVSPKDNHDERNRVECQASR
jgi:hypothetical protein